MMKASQLKKTSKVSVVYLHEVDDLLGGDGLSSYDLTNIVSNEFLWKIEQENQILS